MTKRFGYIVGAHDVDISAVQLAPTADQQDVINRYWHSYQKTLGHSPEGLHWLPELDAFVWLPPTESAPELTLQRRNTVPD